MRRAGLEGLAFLAVPAAVVGAIYLSTYATRHYVFPVGYDTPKYLWRASLAGARGLGSLAGSAPPPFRANADRPGLPVLLDIASSLLHVSNVRLFIVLPAVMAATIGLGAGAVARLALGEPRWAMPVFAVATGASVNVSRMAGPGYTDNLVLTAVIVAAGAIALLAASDDRDDRAPGGRTVVAGALLLAAGALIHWVFVAAFAVLLLAVAVVAIPGSARSWRAGRRPLATASGRLLSTVAGGAAAGGLGLITLLAAEPSPPHLPRESFLRKLRTDVPRYAFPVVGPLAAVGATALVRVPADDADRGTRRADRFRGLAFLLLWAGSGAAAVVLIALGAPVPAHRFLAFGLGLPMLVAAALTGVARLAATTIGRPGRVAGAVLVLAGLTGTSVLAYRAWSGAHPWMPTEQVAQAASAGRYLQSVGGSAPVVFIVDLGSSSPLASTSEAFHVIRSALPPAQIPRTLVYLGDPERFLQGRPTLQEGAGGDGFNQASLQHWPSVRAVLDRHPIALMLRSLDRSFDQAIAAHPDWQVSPDIAVVQGPAVASVSAVSDAVPRPLSPLQLGLVAAAFLLLLAVSGGGWAAAMVDAGWLERAAVAPAFGIAAMVIGGVLADRLGVPLTGPAAEVVVAVVATAGWVWFALSRPGRVPG